MKRPTFAQGVVVASLIMMAYVVIRAAIVWGALDSYGVNMWIFLFLDVVTVPPYTIGIAKMVLGVRGSKPLKEVYIGGAIALGSFLAPYVYLYIAGRAEMPMTTKVIVGVIIIFLFCAGPLRDVLKKSQNR